MSVNVIEGKVNNSIISALEIRSACDSAIWALSPAVEIGEVAEAIAALHALSMNPTDKILRASTMLKIYAANDALLPGAAPDYWLDDLLTGNQTSIEASTVEHISDLVQSREHQIATLRNLISALN